jgi:hypothetical protein
MKARLVFLVALAALSASACRDTIMPPRQPAPGGPQRNVQYAQPANWRGHWQSEREFWTYDATPELGLNSHIHYGPLYDNHIEMVPGAGMRLLRTSMYWALADTTGDGIYNTDPGSYLADFRVKVNLARDRNVDLVGVIVGRFTGIGAPYDGVTSEAEFNRRLVRFASDMVAMFPEVKYWQLWNEMDGGDWAEPWRITQGGTTNRYTHGRGYARTMRAVYPVFRDASPRRWMLVGGLTGIDWNFTRGMYDELELGGKPFPMDIMAIHGYGPNTAHPEAALVKVHSLTPIMAEHNDQNRPIWATETGNGGGQWIAANGWPSTLAAARAGMDEGQRAYYESLANGMGGSPIIKALGYATFAEDGGPSAHTYNGVTYTFEDYTNTLLRTDLVTWRPAYQWLRDRAGTTRAAWDRPAETGSMLLPRAPTVPTSHPYRYTDDGPVADGVVVNSATPTPITTMYPYHLQAYVAGTGWLPSTGNNLVVGTVGQARALRIVRASVGELPAGAEVCLQGRSNLYTTTFSQPMTCGLTVDIGVGNSRSLVEFAARLNNVAGYSLCYQVHVAYDGWLPEACDGALAGAAGREMQAVRFRIYRTS